MKNEKTPLILNRELFNVNIRLQEDLGFLNLNDLQEAYRFAMCLYGWSDKRTSDILSSKIVKKLVYGNLSNTVFVDITEEEFMNQCFKIGPVKVLKNYGLWVTKGRGVNKQVWCHDTLFKIIYVNMFSDCGSANTPDWLSDVSVLMSKRFIKRSESQEDNFCNMLISQSALINSGIEKQFLLDSFRYDLKINLLNKRFLIEYNEEQHALSKNKINDYEKLKSAMDNGFFCIFVPTSLENVQLKYISKILQDNYSLEDVYEFESLRFHSLLEGSALYSEKVENELSNKVFGKVEKHFRQKISGFDLELLWLVEKFIVNAISLGFIKDESQVLNTIKSYA